MLSQFEEEEDDYLNQPIDKQRVPPIHQKRLLAFVNHFIVETVEFLNRLITDVDGKFVRFETKLRKVEDSLAILESKLSSIPDLQQQLKSRDESINQTASNRTEEEPEKEASSSTQSPAVIPKEHEPVDPSTKEPEDDPETSSTSPPPPTISGGVKASEDYRYKKFFKMIHYGVHQQAVKNKLASEGLDPSILDDPNQILADGKRTPPQNSDDESSEDSS